MDSSFRRFAVLGLVLGLGILLLPADTALAADPPRGFTSIFNGTDFSGWKVPEGDGGHWKILDGVIDYDAQSEAEGDKALWSDEEYGNFVLRAEWRIKETPYVNRNVKIILPSGLHKKDADGQDVNMAVPDSDSGIYLRGDAEGAGEHLVLARGIGRGLWLSQRQEAAGDSQGRGGSQAQRRPEHRGVEQLRDHDEGRSAHRGAERPEGAGPGAAPGRAGSRADRAPAPWGEAGWRVGEAAFAGAVPEYFCQGT